jgi:hypothetical protein
MKFISLITQLLEGRDAFNAVDKDILRETTGKQVNNSNLQDKPKA